MPFFSLAWFPLYVTLCRCRHLQLASGFLQFSIFRLKQVVYPSLRFWGHFRRFEGFRSFSPPPFRADACPTHLSLELSEQVEVIFFFLDV